MGDVVWYSDPQEWQCVYCGWKGSDSTDDGACPLCFEKDLIMREPDDDADRSSHDDRGDN